MRTAFAILACYLLLLACVIGVDVLTQPAAWGRPWARRTFVTIYAPAFLVMFAAMSFWDLMASLRDALHEWAGDTWDRARDVLSGW